MAWPPTIPPNTRDNTTAQQNNHPQDHVQTADALTDIVTEVDRVDGIVDQHTVDLSAQMNAYGVDGSINVPNPGFTSQTGVVIRNASNQYIDYLTSTGVSLVDRDTTLTYANTTWSVSTGCSVTLDLTRNGSRAGLFMVQCASQAELKPGEFIYVKPAYRVDGGSYIYAPAAVYGLANNNNLSPGTVFDDVQSLIWTVLIGSGSSVTFYHAAEASTNQTELRNKRISVTPFWR